MAWFRLRWRYFWSRRARGRTLAALLCALLALAAAIYLMLPADEQAAVAQQSQQLASFVSVIGLNTVLAAVIVVFTALSVALLLTPDYRRHTYLIPPGVMIPPVSVYLDEESEPPTVLIPGFVNMLRQYLDGRRADLLFFTQASETAGKPRYVALARYGFRAIDVPHDPTGMGNVKEAVDRELAMHAFERALLGPARQEFIIITKDGDYVPLIYRLCALGHSVQVWSTQESDPYTQLSTYLDMTFLNVARLLTPESTATGENPAPATSTRIPAKALWAQRARSRPARKTHKGRTRETFKENTVSIIIPDDIAAVPGAAKLFRAIEVTRLANDWYRTHSRSDNARYEEFRRELMYGLMPRITGVGYDVGNWVDSWLEHLTILNVFRKEPSKRMPARGPAETGEAAKRLRAMAEAAAAATTAVSERPDGRLHMRTIAAFMGSLQYDPASTGDLGALVAPTNTKSMTHSRCFVRLARGIGLLTFEDVAASPDLLRGPRLLDPFAPDAPASQSAPVHLPEQASPPVAPAEQAPPPANTSEPGAEGAQRSEEPPTPPSLV